MKKTVAMVVVVLLLLTLGFQMFRSNMSKLDEEIVYAYYQKNINAIRRFDAKTLCSMYDQKFRGVEIIQGPRGEERVTMNRRDICESTDESMAMMKQIVAKTRIEPDLKYVIESVSISPDRKQAIVKLRATIRVGKKLSVTSRGTETLVRRMGDVRTLYSESKSTISAR